jgi:glycoside/pentoside/hexuronide:cation symporter, GPH family
MPSLPFSRQIAYAIGQLGWSTLVNIVGLVLVYFYLPPDSAGLPFLISQVTFLGVLNAVTLIAASGRLLDAVTDPLIASFSDRLTHPRGRRIPFLLVGALPAALFCLLLFVPISRQVSALNIAWVVAMQFLFYIFLTVYVTPYFALLPELGHTANERLNLSTWISITYALGIIVAAQTPLLANILQETFGLADKMSALQAAIALLAFVAFLFMLVPALTIDEKKYAQGKPSTVPMLPALRQTFANPNFIYYVVADFAYFMGLTIINTGLLFYVTVLLRQDETLVGSLLALMVLVSFLFYPLVNILARRVGKKPLVTGSFFFMSAIFLAIYFLGRLPLPEASQAYSLVLLHALPIAFLGVLPNAVLADIASHDALRTGESKEGMFFAARTLMQKFGQTFGILVFAALATFGKDPGQDLGIRLSGIAGFVLCLTAGIVFLRYNERQLLREMEVLQAGREVEVGGHVRRVG